VGWLVLAGVALTFATSVLGFFVSLRKIQAVHVLVNSQLHDVLMRVSQLTGTLHSAGVDVPAPAAGRGEAGERLSAGGEDPGVHPRR
jgi:hypothetical protein